MAHALRPHRPFVPTHAPTAPPTQSQAEYDGDSLEGALVTTLDGSSPCVRLFHSGGSIGCREKNDDGKVLPLLSVRGTDFPHVSDLKGAAGRVAVVLTGSLFNASTLEVLRGTGHLGAVLVLDDSTPGLDDADADTCFSPDSSTPQGAETPSRRVAVDGDHAWNVHGNGLMNVRHGSANHSRHTPCQAMPLNPPSPRPRMRPSTFPSCWWTKA